MPLRLEHPRPPKTHNFYVRGSYIGVAVERSADTDDPTAAARILKLWRRQIERGEYRGQVPEHVGAHAPVTFLTAAVAYMKAGGERQYLRPIFEMTGEHALRDLPVTAITQVMIDNAAAQLYPGASAQTRNRQFYTPVSAVMKHGGNEKRIKRPKGWRGRKSTSWLEPAQAFALFAAADALDREFGLFLRLLCYTGMRLSEPLKARLRHLNLSERMLYLPQTKNNEPRPVYLPKVLVVALANHPRGLERGGEARLFRFHAGSRLRDLLKAAMTNAGLSFPRRQGGFHLLCHTYGTWMHRYGGLDNFGLTRTKRWLDPRSADRYLHTQVSEESRRAEVLPVEKKRKRR